MSDTTIDLVADYLACWNETDPAARRARVERLFTASVTYTDPLADVAGHDALDATIAGVQAQFPGWVFSAAGAADHHHAQARFGWGLGPGGAEPPVLGFDVVRLAPDGRIEEVLGFLDRVPA